MLSAYIYKNVLTLIYFFQTGSVETPLARILLPAMHVFNVGPFLLNLALEGPDDLWATNWDGITSHGAFAVLFFLAGFVFYTPKAHTTSKARTTSKAQAASSGKKIN